MDRGTIYGHSRRRRELYATVTATAPDLRGQLEALNRERHRAVYDQRDVQAVHAALFAAHGWR